ncbi:hypothetical protein [Marinobacter shengliensis]|uniref:hypothetical protein n=1 Tax=Marinobacter shengliensis TaxID=1389223 RepID=UPI0011085027|nr:hypothetical protein [Marinobacter shengliensis]
MAYYQFDLTFVNLAALPAGASLIDVGANFSDLSSLTGYEMIQGSGDLTVTLDTSQPQFGNPYEVDAGESIWFTVSVVAGTPPSEFVAIYTIGPYLVGDVGTEVPAP